MLRMFLKFEIKCKKEMNNTVHVSIILPNAAKDVLDAFDNGYFTGFCGKC